MDLLGKYEVAIRVFGEVKVLVLFTLFYRRVLVGV